jgi:hypothetical protein
MLGSLLGMDGYSPGCSISPDVNGALNTNTEFAAHPTAPARPVTHLTGPETDDTTVFTPSSVSALRIKVTGSLRQGPAQGGARGEVVRPRGHLRISSCHYIKEETQQAVCADRQICSAI